MNTTNTTDRDSTCTGYFEGSPCRVIEEWHIIIPRKDLSSKATHAFVESKQFQKLAKAGLEVHQMEVE